MRSTWLIRIIFFFNVMIFLSWFYSFGNKVHLRWMMDHFLVSWQALMEGRYWVLITSAFSHNALFHLLINMFVLRGFGFVLHRLLGTWAFINFYLLAAVSGSFAHALVSVLLIKDPSLPALGASGAIAGIILLFSLLFPKEKLLLLGLIPIPARWAAILIIVLDLWGLTAQSKGGGLPIGHGAHLGGALMGIVWFIFVRHKRDRDF
jgi:membrane associated rhomboid family serine protease